MYCVLNSESPLRGVQCNVILTGMSCPRDGSTLPRGYKINIESVQTVEQVCYVYKPNAATINGCGHYNVHLS